MAKDMLEAVFAAEEECKIRESKAKADAAEAEKRAVDAAKALIAKAENDAKAKAEAKLEQARLNGNAELAKARAEADIKCAAVAKTAEKNRTQVIKNAVGLLLG